MICSIAGFAPGPRGQVPLDVQLGSVWANFDAGMVTKRPPDVDVIGTFGFVAVQFGSAGWPWLAPLAQI
jgi:hypothetical protein